MELEPTARARLKGEERRKGKPLPALCAKQLPWVYIAEAEKPAVGTGKANSEITETSFKGQRCLLLGHRNG